MHHRSPYRRFIATTTAAALFAGTWAPLAAAQASETSPSAPPPAAPEPEAPPDQDSAEATSPTEEERGEQAKDSFEAAQAAFAEEDFKLAYEQFRAAHEILPSPHAEYWMAVSLDRQGDRDAEAARAYQTFLSHPGANHVGDDHVAEAQQRLDELKAKLPARVKVTTEPSGAQISVGQAVQPGTTPLTLELPPGTHQIEASLPGHQPTSVQIDVRGGEELEQQLALEATPPPPMDPAPAPTAVAPEPVERSMLPAYITLGLAGAGLVTGTIFGLKALADKSDFNDNPTAARADSVERSALISDMAFGVAITLGITGLVLLTSSDAEEQAAKLKKKATERGFVFAPVVGPELGGAAARVIF